MTALTLFMSQVIDAVKNGKGVREDALLLALDEAKKRIEFLENERKERIRREA